MSGLPYDPRDYQTHPHEQYYAQPPRTSGLAIASLICGMIGLVTCCTFLPGLVGLGLGIGAWSGISRGEVRGRGLAIAGVAVSVLSLLMGIGVWVVVALSPELRPIPGHELDSGTLKILEDIGALEESEDVELFYSGGFLSVRERGVLITDRRLVVYSDESVKSLALAEVTEIDFTPSDEMWDDSEFLVHSNDDYIAFQVGTEEGGDKMFERVLRDAVNRARRSVGLESLPGEE